MPRMRPFVLSLPLVLLAPVPSWAADSPAITTLKEKGLTRSGRLFLIEAEQAALEKWKATRAVLAGHAAIAERRKEAEQVAQDLEQLEARRVELQENLDMLNQQINGQGFQVGINPRGGVGQAVYLNQLATQRNMIRMNLAEIAAMQKSAKAGPGADAKSLEAESKKSLEAATAALAEARASLDAVTQEYDRLGADAAVKSARRALEKDKVGTFKLGPSPTFKAAAKALENAERTLLAKKPAASARKKGKSRR